MEFPRHTHRRAAALQEDGGVVVQASDLPLSSPSAWRQGNRHAEGRSASPFTSEHGALADHPEVTSRPQGRRAQRDAQHPGRRRGGPVTGEGGDLEPRGHFSTMVTMRRTANS
jgi:hypothetical protein